MASTAVGSLDHDAVVRAAEQAVDLARHDAVVAAWGTESALPGMTVGGLARHLVSQPECAVEFLGLPVPAGAERVPLSVYAGLLDWLDAPVDAEENTSIRDDFNEMAGEGYEASIAVGDAACAALPEAIRAAGPATFVPWQGCALATDDFLLVRLLEIVVHTDDLATSLGLPTPRFEPAVLEPVLGLLAVLAQRRHGQDAVVRTLARAERAGGTVSAFSRA
ncbi:maleylpyruvate isomerase N-terminal domain-containing protein [Beutenbergia cavernae]|uniref:maleylpyruvate isomerase N-terminal domain-containing protein n=1 Tax=Beutenbergia cavernae TaxID=84757 RepID=UPI00019ACC66|nr:maleylpyruvate isomerase N-terminal domain-containing protein [Beutenbergia cavernae]